MTLLEEIDAIRTQAKEYERQLNMKRCRYCHQWYNRRALAIELFGYCSIACLEIDYASFRHMKRKVEGEAEYSV